MQYYLKNTQCQSLRNAGFTLAEVVLVAAVMAVLITISFPPFVDYLQQRDIQKEEQELAEISRAIEAFAQQNNGLPDEDTANNTTCNTDPTTTNTWAECLANFSQLSAEQIATDVWEQPRSYIHFTREETFLGAKFDIHYASVHSKGANRDAENEDNSGAVIEGLAVESTVGSDGFADFLPTTNTAWWANDSVDPVAEFNALQAGGDDLLIKYTDHHTKIDRYHTTLQRMKDIADALETYSKAKYNEHVVNIANSAATDEEKRAWVSAVNEIIFYPPSQPQTGTDSAYYAPNTVEDFGGGAYAYTTFSPTYGYSQAAATQGLYNGNNDATRYADMVRLMRVLGLPDTHCCNAMARLSTDITGDGIVDVSDEQPLFYFSNPRPRTSGTGCGTRPTADVNSSTADSNGYFLPPRLRIRVENNDGTCG